MIINIKWVADKMPIQSSTQRLLGFKYSHLIDSKYFFLCTQRMKLIFVVKADSIR